jgi:hypothetical protein
MTNVPEVETMLPEEAGKILHKSAEFVRAGLRQERFPFGTAVQNNNGSWNYIIFKNKFYKYLET